MTPCEEEKDLFYFCQPTLKAPIGPPATNVLVDLTLIPSQLLLPPATIILLNMEYPQPCTTGAYQFPICLIRNLLYTNTYPIRLARPYIRKTRREPHIVYTYAVSSLTLALNSTPSLH